MKRVGAAGTEPVINQERMLVREKVDTGQFEWYRDNKWNLLPSQALCLRRFFILLDRPEDFPAE